MISLGHKHIAFVGTLFSQYHIEDIMLQTFTETMQEHSLAVNHSFLKEAHHMGVNIPSLINELLQETVRPTAIVCTDDPLAVMSINILREYGIVVPQEISVTGFNDLPLAKISQPALTTLRVPRYEMGKEAADFLHRLMNGETISLRKLVSLELVIRGSCKGKSILGQYQHVE